MGEEAEGARDLASVARVIVNTNLYMTLVTADAAGRPCASPVWYAASGYTEFYWISSPEARHSRKIASRPEVAVGAGQAVYVRAVAEELAGTAQDRGTSVFSRASQEEGNTVDAITHAAISFFEVVEGPMEQLGSVQLGRVSSQRLTMSSVRWSLDREPSRTLETAVDVPDALRSEVESMAFTVAVLSLDLDPRRFRSVQANDPCRTQNRRWPVSSSAVRKKPRGGFTG
jgi:Pyridoxamine 5'-phosphate oxidase